MKIDINHLAKLADLKLTPEEKGKISRQLSETLDYIQNLNELDTNRVEETNHTVDLSNEFFSDGKKNTRGLSREEVFKTTSHKKNNFFAVKKIL